MARIRLPGSTDSLHTNYKFNVPPILQPRLTWRYCLASTALAYVLYCFLFNKPFFSSKLPQYTGPYNVGAIDIEVPVREQRLVDTAVFKDSGEPAFELKTVLFTMYYPAAKGVRSGKHHYWVPKPLWLTSFGYAKVARINNFFTNNLFTSAMGILVGGTKIPAHVDVPVVSTEEIAKQVRSSKESSSFKNFEPTSFQSDTESSGLPVIIFTHGMASSRTQYSHYLGELASRGYICAAIEHRDGSGPGTQIIDSSTSSATVIDRLHFSLSDVKAPSDTDTKIEADDFKRMQLAFREAEILETVHVVHSLHSGSGDTIIATNSRKEGSKADLPSFTGRLNINTTILAGHSYGATGALQGLKPRTDMARIFAGGIALDPGKSSGRLNTDVDVPILIIHSTSWSAKRSIFYGRPHFEVVREIADNLNAKGIGSWFMTSLGTSHPSVTDAPLIEPTLLKWTTGAGIDAHEGLRQYVHVSDDFAKFVQDGKERNLLALPANSREYDRKNEGMDKEWREYWQVHASPVKTKGEGIVDSR
ncbi:hypothetical protein LTR64_005658 [Lithohypha guttulata]|uniref:uncharacterized protein n=1 Tax=Lithohypha guttulata TaxID=1690604 RepID=UPI002DE17E54|nr:hypothetical protein LTR51_002548 [Lithohypha guttulata]